MFITDQSLAPFHTFGLQVKAAFFVNLQHEEQIDSILALRHRPRLILGSGSNVLFTKNFAGLIIRNAIMGIRVLENNQDYVIVEAGGGEVWHDLVLWSLEHNLGGLENLSLIPGTVGAAPIQNIGAYGVEFDSVFHQLEAIELASGHSRVFTKDQCGFAYRTSIFKRELKNRFLITKVQLKLNKGVHKLALDYGEIKNTLLERGIANPNIRDISDCVIAIRTRKLPDPSKIGNAGSFFKNPIISESSYLALLADYPDMPSYLVENGRKIPAAWLIEHAGWKGYRKGDAGVYDNHALVLVNHGHATGQEMYQLAEAISDSIQQIFQIELEPEVNFI
ncbi:MAG: UDP-N-acetylmuramate dehydrogenase [Saprospiraceae bacterium]|nr:UDP-N-acetylmuramate dehydrogenase [Saprospiraceae bacterium]